PRMQSRAMTQPNTSKARDASKSSAGRVSSWLGVEVMADVQSRLPELPEVFSRHDLCQALGYHPDRALLYRVLGPLLRDETLLIESYGFRRRPTRYRKAVAELSPEPAGGLES